MGSQDMTLTSLRARYLARPGAIIDVMDELARRIDAWPDKAVFIARHAPEELRDSAMQLLARCPDPRSLPLWGTPFAVKDNIDAIGFDTTAACPAYAYKPACDATAVARLRNAGGILVGKTNLDQFATGLNGTRSPYGAPRSVFNPDYISGGSSSGSAVAVAAGLASFALGTDTAGSGRVPAAFNNIVGVKPTPGLVGATGVVPACRSLDCVSIFAMNVSDGVAIRRLIEGPDPEDSFNRLGQQKDLPATPVVGVLRDDDAAFPQDAEFERLYRETIARAQSLGWRIVSVEYGPLAQIASLLYDGPWLAERLAAIGDFVTAHPADVDASVRAIVESARGYSAVDAFRGQYEFRRLSRLAMKALEGIDFLLLPSAPTTYTVEAMRADPIRLNANLGRYTNFVNLLGFAAIAVPAGFSVAGLPFGVTLVAREFCDDALAPFAALLHHASGAGAGLSKAPVAKPPQEPCASDEQRFDIVVVGAHLTGEPLNRELVQLGGRFVRANRTTGDYRLFVLPDATPAKPGLIRSPGREGPGIEVEIWSLSAASFAQFVSAIPAPLGIGTIELQEGARSQGFLCEEYALRGAEEITNLGGWRAYRRSR